MIRLTCSDDVTRYVAPGTCISAVGDGPAKDWALRCCVGGASLGLLLQFCCSGWLGHLVVHFGHLGMLFDAPVWLVCCVNCLRPHLVLVLALVSASRVRGSGFSFCQYLLPAGALRMPPLNFWAEIQWCAVCVATMSALVSR